MPFASLARWSLRIVLALCLVVSGMAVGLGGDRGEPGDAAASTSMPSQTPAAMPCHGGVQSDASDDAPCDCCPQRSCDTAACSLMGCIPAVLRVAATPPAAAPGPVLSIAPPSARLEPPLRPPIA